MQADCPFCLENHLLKADTLAETSGGFLIEANNFPGNYLIVPKSHAESLLDLPDDWWRDVKELLPHMPQQLEQFNMSVNIGKNAGQTVKHVHFWIVPRMAGLPTSGKGLVSLVAGK